MISSAKLEASSPKYSCHYLTVRRRDSFKNDQSSCLSISQRERRLCAAAEERLILIMKKDVHRTISPQRCYKWHHRSGRQAVKRSLSALWLRRFLFVADLCSTHQKQITMCLRANGAHGIWVISSGSLELSKERSLIFLADLDMCTLDCIAICTLFDSRCVNNYLKSSFFSWMNTLASELCCRFVSSFCQ